MASAADAPRHCFPALRALPLGDNEDARQFFAQLDSAVNHSHSSSDSSEQDSLPSLSPSKRSRSLSQNRSLRLSQNYSLSRNRSLGHNRSPSPSHGHGHGQGHTPALKSGTGHVYNDSASAADHDDNDSCGPARNTGLSHGRGQAEDSTSRDVQTSAHDLGPDVLSPRATLRLDSDSTARETLDAVASALRRADAPGPQRPPQPQTACRLDRAAAASTLSTSMPLAAPAPTGAASGLGGHTVGATRIQTAEGTCLLLPPGVPLSVVAYIEECGPDSDILPSAQHAAAPGTYAANLPLDELHHKLQRRAVRPLLGCKSSDRRRLLTAGDDDDGGGGGDGDTGAPRQLAETALAGSAAASRWLWDAAPSSKRPRLLAHTASADDAPLRCAKGQPRDHRARHKQTADWRRRRINRAIENLRRLLHLEARTGKADVLGAARQALVERLAVGQPRPEPPRLPCASIIIISCSTQTIVDANVGALMALGLARADLPLDSHQEEAIRVREDRPYILPGVAEVVSGARQAATICSRFRAAGGGSRTFWGRLTLTRSLVGDTVYLTGVGSFFDEAPPSGAPYYIF